jgi:hypothetical protein
LTSLGFVGTMVGMLIFGEFDVSRGKLSNNWKVIYPTKLGGNLEW